MAVTGSETNLGKHLIEISTAVQKIMTHSGYLVYIMYMTSKAYTYILHGFDQFQLYGILETKWETTFISNSQPSYFNVFPLVFNSNVNAYILPNQPLYCHRVHSPTHSFARLIHFNSNHFSYHPVGTTTPVS